jgi:uncharacterized protein (UPF0335 family)
MNIFIGKLYAANATCMRQAFTDCCKRECEAWQKTIERLEGEDKLCLKNGREVLADNIGLGKASKTENDIF